jgi:phage tail sheath protein FI
LTVKGFFDNGGQQLYVKRVFAGGGGLPGQGATAASALFGQGLIADIALDANSAATSVKLSHLIDVQVGHNLNFYTPGKNNPLNAAPLPVVSYIPGQNTVTFKNPLGFSLKAGRDIAVVEPITAPTGVGAKPTLTFSAKALGDWGSNLQVKVMAMVGGTFTILPDPIAGGASFSSTITGGDVPAGTTTLSLVDVSGFKNNDHARIGGVEYVVSNIVAGTNKLDVSYAGNPGLVVAASNGSSVTRVRIASAAGATSLHISGSSAIYPNAILQLDNGQNKDTAVVSSVTGDLVTLGTALVNAYYEGQKARVIEAEVDTQNVVNNVVTASEVLQNLRLFDDQTSNYIVTGVNLRSNLVNVATAASYSSSDLTQFPAAPVGTEWVQLQGGHDNNDQLTVEDFIGVDGGSGMRTGIQALEDITDISICIVPGMWSQSVQAALINHCETLKYRFGILDPPDNLSIDGITSFREPLDTEYAALYYPWVQVLDPSVVRNVDVAPSGHMAGIYAQTDIARGVFKAPANVEIAMISKIAQDVNTREQALLNPIGINALRRFPERGNRVWGARTLSSDSDWKYVNVRRLFIYIEASIDNGTQWVVFEPNDQRLWARVRQTITDFLTSTWQSGALQGATPNQAFFVQCDLGTTMTQDDLNNGRLIVIVGIAPVRPAEFVIFRIQQIMQAIPAS